MTICQHHISFALRKTRTTQNSVRSLVPHRYNNTRAQHSTSAFAIRGTFLLQTGQLHTYLAAIPVMSSTWGTTLAYCTSLQELAVMDVMSKGSQRRITIPTEPAFLATGPHHLAVGMNNKVCSTKHWGCGGGVHGWGEPGGGSVIMSKSA